MSITINYSGVTVSGSTVTFDDIYNYAVANNLTSYISKSNNSFEIKGDLVINNNGTIYDTNKFITVLGDLIQIHKGSSLHLGTKRLNGSTLDGCTLNAPNIKLVYGFGCVDKTDSGDLFLYNSTINVYGFWSFFSGANHVEVIDCFVDGFGRIEGKNSILKNIIFKRSHGRYGALSPKGTLKVMENLSIYDSVPYYDTATSKNITCSLYHNPAYAPDLDIYYGTYDGYGDLAYIEPNGSVRNKLTLKGSTVKNGYSLHRVSTNVDFYHQFRFKPQLLKIDGSAGVGLNVEISDNAGKVVYSGVTDQYGYIDTWVTYYEDVIATGIKTLTPHTVKITDGTIISSTVLFINKNFEDFPLYFVDTTSSGVGGTIDYSIIQGMITQATNDICACETTNKTEVLTAIAGNSTKLDANASDLRAIKVAQGTNIAETETIIETVAGARLVL